MGDRVDGDGGELRVARIGVGRRIGGVGDQCGIAAIVRRRVSCGGSAGGREPVLPAAVCAVGACLKTRPVRGPGLQATVIQAESCRPRARTRRFRGICPPAASGQRLPRRATMVGTLSTVRDLPSLCFEMWDAVERVLTTVQSDARWVGTFSTTSHLFRKVTDAVEHFPTRHRMCLSRMWTHFSKIETKARRWESHR